jgi:hypothetical protein
MTIDKTLWLMMISYQGVGRREYEDANWDLGGNIYLFRQWSGGKIISWKVL